ncbi:hypothetical protein Tco_0637646 [Tanacetum coccineum]
MTSSPTPTTIPNTTSIPALPDFSSLLGFDQRVSTLEIELSQLKQADQSAQLLKLVKSQLLTIVDDLLSTRIGYATRTSLKSYTKDFEKKAQEERKLYIDVVEKSLKDIIKDEVKSLLPQILPKPSVNKKKTSKDAKPSRGSKLKESKSSSSKRSKSQPKSSGKSAQEEELAKKPPLMFNELLSTPIDFSVYVMHNLKIDNLTQEILVGHAFNLLKGTCKSFMELEYHFKEYYKAVTDQHNWNNPEGHGYPFDLNKPLPLIEAKVCQVVPADYFFNNDLEYLKGIKDMVPELWSPVKVAYDKFSMKRIIVVTYVKVMKWYGYGYLEEIIVRREDQSLHKFKEGDFPRLNLHDIEDLLLLLVQKKLSNLEQYVIFDLNVALFGISKLTPYTAYKNPQGIIYQDKFRRNKLMLSDKLYKFCDGTLTSVRRVLHDIANNLMMDYLPKRRWSNLDKKRSRIMIKAIDQQLFERRLMRNLEKFVGGRDYRNDFRLLERTI